MGVSMTDRMDAGRWREVLLVVLCVCGIVFCGCSVEETSRTKISDITYTIVEDAQIPEELAAIIEEKKAADFKFTYELQDELYVIRGYGEQETGGYSICVKECYQTSNAVVFDTELKGPRKGETTSMSPSYPYIVVKMENYEKSVIFD